MAVCFVLVIKIESHNWTQADKMENITQLVAITGFFLLVRRNKTNWLFVLGPNIYSELELLHSQIPI